MPKDRYRRPLSNLGEAFRRRGARVIPIAKRGGIAKANRPGRAHGAARPRVKITPELQGEPRDSFGNPVIFSRALNEPAALRRATPSKSATPAGRAGVKVK